MNLDVVLARKAAYQSQLNISHADAMALLAMAGAPHNIHLGNPRNGMPSLRLLVKVKNRKIHWVQGDTHALWLAHQDEEDGRTIFDKLLRQLALGDSVTVEVIGAQFFDGKPKNMDDLLKPD